jgi:hypothetical protein
MEKQKVKISLCLNKHYARGTYEKWMYKGFQKELYSGIPNVVWRGLLKEG